MRIGGTLVVTTTMYYRIMVMDLNENINNIRLRCYV